MSSTPPLPSSLPPETSKIDDSKEKWILNEDIEVTQYSDQPNSEDPSQVASQMRLQADLDIVVPADKLLKPAHVPKRRR